MVFMSKFQSVLFYNLKSCQKYFKSSTNCIILRGTEGLITQKRSCLIAILSANTCASVRVFLDPQGLQNNLERESSTLQDLESQKQDAQVRLEEMDQQRSRLEGMLNDIKQKCQDETQKVRDVTHWSDAHVFQLRNVIGFCVWLLVTVVHMHLWFYCSVIFLV